MNKHRRNIIVDSDLALRAMDYHGGMGSMLYSLCSTAFAGDLVSVSMVDAGLSELEGFTPEDDDSSLEDIIAELQEISDNPEENSSLHLLGEDKDAGFATWLQDEDDSESEELEESQDGVDFLSDIDSDVGEGMSMYDDGQGATETY